MKKQITIYIPAQGIFLQTGKGTGDNLLKEDRENGYVDYVYIATYYYTGDGIFEEFDGGEMLLEESFESKYNLNSERGLSKLIKDSLSFMELSNVIDYIVIKEQVE